MEILSVPNHISIYLPVIGAVLVMLQFQTYVTSNKCKTIEVWPDPKV